MWPIIGALAAIAIGMMAMRPYEQDAATQMQNVHAAATASDWTLIDNAATAYIKANYAAVEANSTAETPAVITVPMLEATGELPASFSALNPFGQTWVVQVLQPTAGTLQTMVLSTGGTEIPEKLAPLIANLVGQEGGIVPYNRQNGTLNSSTAVGSYGGWSIPLTGYTNPGPGHLASLLAFNNGNLQNDYLYRNAVPGQPALNTMATTLNMGDNPISDAGTIAANGGTTLIANEQDSPGGPGGDYLRLTGTNSQQMFMQNYNGTLRWVGNGFANVPMSLTQAGQLSTNQVTLPPGNSLSIGSNYFYGDTANAAVRTPGGFYVQNYAGGPAPISETSSVSLTPLAGANSGWGCAPNGEIASNANGSGQLMACTNGAWQAVGGGNEIITANANPALGPGPSPGPTCPGGYSLVNWVNVSSYGFWTAVALCSPG